MNFTPQYIKMVDCPEIQKNAPQIDFHARHAPQLNHKVHVQLDAYGNYFGFNNKERTLYLPTQQDLQGMVNLPLYRLVWDFEEFMANWSETTMFDGWSMEELWLLFIMHRLHHKQWNGNEWVKEEDYRSAAIDYQADMKEANHD